MSDDEARSAPLADDKAAPEVIDGIRSLHSRIDELHRLVAQRLEAEGMHAGEWLHEAGGAAHQGPSLPAWRRRTQGELRWPVALTTAAGIALQVAVPDKLVLVSPSWVFPAAQGALLIVLIMANPQRIDRESTILRSLSLVLAAMLSLANGYSVAALAVGITRGTMGREPGQLLITGGVIWLTNVIAFALWYWEFDRGGPVARALNLKTVPGLPVPADDQPGDGTARLGARLLRLPLRGVHERHGVQPHRRDAHVPLGQGRDDRAVAHFDRDRRPRGVPRGQHPADRLTPGTRLSPAFTSALSLKDLPA